MIFLLDNNDLLVSEDQGKYTFLVLFCLLF